MVEVTLSGVGDALALIILANITFSLEFSFLQQAKFSLLARPPKEVVYVASRETWWLDTESHRSVHLCRPNLLCIPCWN